MSFDVLPIDISVSVVLSQGPELGFDETGWGVEGVCLSNLS